MSDMFMDPIERRAREIWAEREKGFPKFVQQTWEQGTDLARQTTLVLAAKQMKDTQ